MLCIRVINNCSEVCGSTAQSYGSIPDKSANVTVAPMVVLNVCMVSASGPFIRSCTLCDPLSYEHCVKTSVIYMFSVFVCGSWGDAFHSPVPACAPHRFKLDFELIVLCGMCKKGFASLSQFAPFPTTFVHSCVAPPNSGCIRWGASPVR